MKVVSPVSVWSPVLSRPLLEYASHAGCDVSFEDPVRLAPVEVVVHLERDDAVEGSQHPRNSLSRSSLAERSSRVCPLAAAYVLAIGRSAMVCPSTVGPFGGAWKPLIWSTKIRLSC